MLVPIKLSGSSKTSTERECNPRTALPSRLSVPERAFLVPPSGSPPYGLECTLEELPNEVPPDEEFQRALEHLRVQREQEDREHAGGGSGDMFENEGLDSVHSRGRGQASVSVCRTGVIAVVLPSPMALGAG